MVCWQKDLKIVEDVFSDYFKSIFSTSNPPNDLIHKFLEPLPCKISKEMNVWLGRSFTREEVIQAFKNINPSKALRLDGFPGSFYRSFWDVFGNEVVDVILRVLNEDVPLKLINKTATAPIPKIKNPGKVTHFRPISLCNVTYKIVSKCLANRLKKKLLIW